MEMSYFATLLLYAQNFLNAIRGDTMKIKVAG